MIGDGFTGSGVDIAAERVLVFEVAAGPDQEVLTRAVRASFGFVTVWRTDHLVIAYPGQQGGTILVLSGLLGDPEQVAEQAHNEPFPPAVAAAIAVVADERRVPPSQIGVISFHEQEWPDGCLGLPATGDRCDGDVVLGWSILLNVGGRSVEVHTDAVGSRVRTVPTGAGP
jgi:hypothetical protein